MMRWSLARAQQCAPAVLLALQGVALLDAAGTSRSNDVLSHLRVRACASVEEVSRQAGTNRVAALTVAPECEARAPLPSQAVMVRIGNLDGGDGTLVGRARIAESPAVALDVISYLSDGLTVGGLLCYPNDGQPHSTVIHVPGGVGGVFVAAAGNLVQACIDWAGLHGRTAFAPSLRGQDGGQGQTELCLGEANDVVSAAAMLRALEVVDPQRVALVGGSIGGCVALRAAPHIPNLAAVVAFVPPMSWKDLVHYHRTSWTPSSEVACDGSVEPRNLGGPAFADAFDSVICGQAGCTDAQYESRSPLPYISVQRAPTLIVAAEHDNIVPLEQQLLWSLFRQGTGHPVSIASVDKCAAPGTPAAATDGLVLARGAYHLLPGGPVSSGMLFLMQALDAVQPVSATPRLDGTSKGLWFRSGR